MKYLLPLISIIIAQTTFAQYTFKYESNITELEEIPIEDKVSKASNISGDEGYYSKTYKTNSGDTVTIVPKISIYVKNDDEIDKTVKQFGNKLSFKKKVGWVFVFDCNVKNSDEVLEITTTLSQNKEVISCDAFTDARMESFNTFYSKQYYLHNASTGSVGINMESAWGIASGLGQDVIVAVIDEGIDHNHEDLPNVLDGYTVGNSSGKGDPLESNNAHGVACAGIIGAGNNSIGIRGIASHAKILPVNLCTSWDYQENKYVYADDQSIAEAILWASERADVLSCSWGNGKGTEKAIITLAIKKAMTEGRNGKGCVVVFSSGNFAQYTNGLAYPASVEGVISVGAVDKNGNIWNYSQRGAGLSLVAPSGNGSSSSDIVTTDRMGSLGYTTTNYTEHFNGTSAACPQVAGVAALMLSIRPDLTAAEVKDVLERTATDLGTTGYDTTYGHGLLNAETAVKEIAPSISGRDIAKSNSDYRITNFPENASVAWSVEDEDKDKINLTVSGEGDQICKAELNGIKTVRTHITAVVKVGDMTVATLKKYIVLLGTLSGTYSVPATTVNGVSFPAIVNRPFFAGSTLEARAGAFITINSDDLNYYSSSWSGGSVENWTVGLDFIRFSLPKSASTGHRTVLEFNGYAAGGTAKVTVLAVNPPPPHSINAFHDGATLIVAITKEKPTDYPEDCTEAISELSAGNYSERPVADYSETGTTGNVWTIEILNVTTGARQGTATTSTGECGFDISAWPAGIYLIRASNGRETLTKKATIK